MVDTRPVDQRDRDGVLPGAVVVDRTGWSGGLDPTSPYRIPEMTDGQRRAIVVGNEGHSSWLALREG